MPESPADKAMLTQAQRRLPLNGLKVLDLTLARAGPTAVRHLADWGADVIKIEPPATDGEEITGNRHGFDFQNLHRNKRAMTLNLREAEGVAIFKRLAERADVVVENYRPDVKRRLGIDYESLRAVNPRLIYGSISGFGQTGPYRDRPGVDQIAQGMGGLMSITGIPGQGPVRVGIPIADLCSGILLAQGILVALLQRERTGEGQWVHTSLLEAMLSMLDFQASRWLMSGEIPPQAGNNHPTGIPTGVFETKDGHINIAAAGDDLWDRFCRAIERPDLRADPRFATSRARSGNRDVLMELLMPVTRQKPSAEWIRILNDAGVPCGPIYRVDESFADPQVRHLEMAQPVHSPVLGDITILGHPVSHGAKRLPIRTAAPELGQDNEEILTSLGYSKDQIADLAHRGII
jgi:formyl-CoA transferase